MHMFCRSQLTPNLKSTVSEDSYIWAKSSQGSRRHRGTLLGIPAAVVLLGQGWSWVERTLFLKGPPERVAVRDLDGCRDIELDEAFGLLEVVYAGGVPDEVGIAAQLE